MATDIGREFEEYQRSSHTERLRERLACAGESECDSCPLNDPADTGRSCIDELKQQAGSMIARLYDANEKAAEENRKLRDATEEICQRQMAEMVRLAGEMNTSAERGLAGANRGQFDELLQCQKVLTELGRGSAIRTEPMEDGVDRVLGIRVGGKVIFGEFEDNPSDPLTRASSPERGAERADG